LSGKDQRFFSPSAANFPGESNSAIRQGSTTFAVFDFTGAVLQDLPDPEGGIR